MQSPQPGSAHPTAETLVAFSDDTLDPALYGDVVSHVAQCAECTSAVADVRAINDALHFSPAPESHPADDQAALAALRKTTQELLQPRRTGLRTLGGILATAAVLMLGVTLLWKGWSSRRESLGEQTFGRDLVAGFATPLEGGLRGNRLERVHFRVTLEGPAHVTVWRPFAAGAFELCLSAQDFELLGLPPRLLSGVELRIPADPLFDFEQEEGKETWYFLSFTEQAVDQQTLHVIRREVEALDGTDTAEGAKAVEARLRDRWPQTIAVRSEELNRS